MPYNTETPIGYAVTALQQVCVIPVLGTVFVPLITLFVGFCMFFVAFISDIQIQFAEIDLEIIERTKKIKSSDANSVEFILLKTIKFHSDALM